MINQFDFETDEQNRELIRSYTADFPCACKYTDFDMTLDHSIPWHWHPAFEITYIIEGETLFQAENQLQHIRAGEMIFANSNVLHCLYPPVRPGTCRHYSIFFDTRFLAGDYGSLLETKYLYPIIRSRSLPIYKIAPDNRRHLKMTEDVLDIIDLHKNEPFGYEFQVRNRLSDFWCLLLEDTHEIRKNAGDFGIEDKTLSDRMRPMLTYIENNYGDDIKLKDIAKAGAVSERECTRVFNQAIGSSPISYLNTYRIRTAARELIMTDDSVGLIGQRCGFASSSHFAQVFHAVMELTPREYRKSHRSAGA